MPFSNIPIKQQQYVTTTGKKFSVDTYNGKKLLKNDDYQGQKTPASGIYKKRIGRKRRSYDNTDDRITQFLRHISTYLFQKIANDENGYRPVVEVQCMYIASINTLFINENAPQSFSTYMMNLSGKTEKEAPPLKNFLGSDLKALLGDIKKNKQKKIMNT